MRKKILLPAFGIIILTAVSCSKNDAKNETSKQQDPKPYVKMDGQAGWTNYSKSDNDCVGAGNTCAPEMVITYDPTFWDALIDAWNHKCNDDPYWAFNAPAGKDLSFAKLLHNNEFKANFCTVNGISGTEYDQMTFGQYFKYIFPYTTNAIMSKMASGNYTMKFKDQRSTKGKAFLMVGPKGTDPARNPEFVLQLKF